MYNPAAESDKEELSCAEAEEMVDARSDGGPAEEIRDATDGVAGVKTWQGSPPNATERDDSAEGAMS